MKHFETYECENGSHWPRGRRGPGEGTASRANPVGKLLRLLVHIPLIPFVLLTMLCVRLALPLLNAFDKGRGR